MSLAAAQVTSATTLVTTAETTAVSTPSVPITPTGQAATQPGTSGIVIRGAVNVTPGTGAGSLVVRCRVGSLTGALIGNALIIGCAAGVIEQVAFEFEDSIYPDAAQGYFITVTQGGATGNGTVNQANAEVDVVAP